MTKPSRDHRRGRFIPELGENRLLDEHQAAERLGLSVKTLRRWRWLKRGVPWIRVGAAVRYAPGDLSAFIEANRQAVSASEDGRAA
jgi:Helix-turn-helix domain